MTESASSSSAAEQLVSGMPPMPPVLTKQIVYTDVPIGVQVTPDGERRIQVVDFASGTVHIFPLHAEGARDIGKKLLSGNVELATAADIPPTP